VISDGSIKTPLHEDDVRAACGFFIEQGIDAVAISFVWSVLNQRHERRAAEIVREMMPSVALTLGSELYPQVREYTRTSTAVVNAYLAPILTRYVAAVDDYFRKLGAKFPVRYFQSNGGLGLGQALSERSVYASIPGRRRHRRPGCSSPRRSRRRTSSPSTWAAPPSTSRSRATASPISTRTSTC
jgi:N-methylhydantoinase A